MPSLKDIRLRRTLDFRILQDMGCQIFQAEAYKSDADRRTRVNRVVDEEGAINVSKYRFIYRLPTMVDKDVFERVTEIGIDTDVPDYPIQEPGTSILSSHTPWSPHFKSGLPVCIGGEFWAPKRGHVTLGHLAIHLAHLLNWDEKGRGAGYVGWNAAAVAHHRDKYRGAPLNAEIDYPTLPPWLYGATPKRMEFSFLGAQPKSFDFSFKS
jgi:hypothetical protein